VTRLNPGLAKMHRSYTVEEVARLFGTHRNTVRNWLRAGLKSIDDHRPVMIQGQVLRAFLQARREGAKRPCLPGTVYCCKCRAPRPPENGSVSFATQTGCTGILRAICEICGTRMFRRARLTDLEAIMPLLQVMIVQAQPHIAECALALPNCAEERTESP
jgi:hypothetical protein